MYLRFKFVSEWFLLNTKWAMFSAKPSWQGQVTIRLDDDHNVLDYVACLSEKQKLLILPD
jgi:hypothetical protein